MKIGDIHIGEGYSPFIVAEMSGNHNQSLVKALEMVEVAAQIGVHAIKLQTYTADTMTLDSSHSDFTISEQSSPWNGKHLYNLYEEASTPWEWHKEIFEYAAKLGIVCFSTPFDETAVDFLEQFDPPAYKIASFENTHGSLVRKVAQTGRPVIVSTGMMSELELHELVGILQQECNSNYVLLKCTSNYPSSPGASNLLTMAAMGKKFGCIVGLSDHTRGVGVSLAAVGLGASVIEKHFTINRGDGGPDALFSMEPDEMELLVNEARNAFQAVGQIHYGPTHEEQESLMFRRSIYVTREIKLGGRFTTDNLRIVRPGYGLSPKYLPEIIGRISKKELSKGNALKWEDIDYES